jgi:hypothetical protein
MHNHKYLNKCFSASKRVSARLNVVSRRIAVHTHLSDEGTLALLQANVRKDLAGRQVNGCEV